MKIDIILTGGTIGTVVKNNDATLDDTYIFGDLLEGKNHQFSIHSPFIIHSEDLVPSFWGKLHEEILVIKGSDGIIILHGTDTLVNTAAFLSLVHGDTKVPIILVSAHSPINNPTTNARENFDMALVAIENKARGVFVSYQNDNREMTLFHANKIMNFIPFTHELCAAKKPYAVVLNGKYEIVGENFNEEKIDFKLPVNKVVLIPAMAGTDFSFYLSNPSQPDSYLVELYHSTTACVSNEFPNHSFAAFIEKCYERNVKVYLAPYENREYFYASKKYFEKTFPLTNDTIAVAYTRLLFKNY